MMYPTEAVLNQVADWLSSSRRVVVLTGAGMSTESGIPDFRSQNGLWNQSDLPEMLTDSALRNHGDVFWSRFKQVFLTENYVAAKPNPGHSALQQLESPHRQVVILTQNVDGLHQAAGSKVVLELHGNARMAYCPRCGSTYEMEDFVEMDVPTCCWETPKGSVCDTLLYPDTVLFGQEIHHFGRAAKLSTECDLFFVCGTSLTVDPVASLPQLRPPSAKLVIVNLEETPLDDCANAVMRGRTGEVLPMLVQKMR